MFATWRLVMASWHSLARSLTLRMPRMMATAPTERAKSTVSPEYVSTRTGAPPGADFTRSATHARARSRRSSKLKSAGLLGLWPMASTISLNMPRERSSTSRCPSVIGSKLPV